MPYGIGQGPCEFLAGRAEVGRWSVYPYLSSACPPTFTGSQTQFRKPRVVVWPATLRPAKLAVSFSDGQVVDACKAVLH